MRQILSVLAVLVVLAGCQNVVGTVKNDESTIATVCSDVKIIADVAGFISEVETVAKWVNAGCATVDGLKKLVSDPSSVAWLGTLKDEMKAEIDQAGFKLTVVNGVTKLIGKI